VYDAAAGKFPAFLRLHVRLWFMRAGIGSNGPTGFSRKVLGEADPGPFVTSPLRVVCGFSHDAGIFCFTQGQPESWPPGP
jgi:hypothetical protein